MRKDRRRLLVKRLQEILVKNCVQDFEWQIPKKMGLRHTHFLYPYLTNKHPTSIAQQNIPQHNVGVGYSPIRACQIVLDCGTGKGNRKHASHSTLFLRLLNVLRGALSPHSKLLEVVHQGLDVEGWGHPKDPMLRAPTRAKVHLGPGPSWKHLWQEHLVRPTKANSPITWRVELAMSDARADGEQEQSGSVSDGRSSFFGVTSARRFFRVTTNGLCS